MPSCAHCTMPKNAIMLSLLIGMSHFHERKFTFLNI
uniref:Uncharacterized protein n=1 Tax=Arundo donax TaxID=35708 RepID=A0A0A8ZFH6_ARUDO